MIGKAQAWGHLPQACALPLNAGYCGSVLISMMALA